MKKKLIVKHISLLNGERYKLLVDAESGIPLYYPSLYITTHVRGAGHSVSTIQSDTTSTTILSCFICSRIASANSLPLW